MEKTVKALVLDSGEFDATEPMDNFYQTDALFWETETRISLNSRLLWWKLIALPALQAKSLDSFIIKVKAFRMTRTTMSFVRKSLIFSAMVISSSARIHRYSADIDRRLDQPAFVAAPSISTAAADDEESSASIESMRGSRALHESLHSDEILPYIRELQEQESSFCQIPIAFDPLRGHKQVYTVGVLAIRGEESAFSEFNATFADYLTRTAGRRFDPPIRFELRPLLFKNLFVDAQQVDFLYVNPSAYSCVESEFEASSLVSQVSRRNVGGNTYDLKKFGGVIATLQDRDDINTITDLKDKIIAAASISGLGSGQMQFREMVENGMNYLDRKSVV